MDDNTLSNEGGCNFDIGREAALGNLNDIYGKTLQVSKQKYLPTRTLQGAFASDNTDVSRHMASLRLRLVTQPEAYGLAIWNPCPLTSTGSAAVVTTDDVTPPSHHQPHRTCDAKHVTAFAEAWSFFNDVAWMPTNAGLSIATQRESLLVVVDLDASLDDMAEAMERPTSVTNAPTPSADGKHKGKDKEQHKNNTAPVVKADELRLFVVPQYLALAVFGTAIYEAHFPDGVDADMAKVDTYMTRRRELWGTDFFQCMRGLGPLVQPTSTSTSTAAPTGGKTTMTTQPLTSTLTMRSNPIDQLAIVASTCLQLRRSILEANTEDTLSHLPRGILCLPCGIGKTNIAIASWLGVGDPRYSHLTTANFGFVRHGTTATAFTTWKRTLEAATVSPSETQTEITPPSTHNPYDLCHRPHYAPRMLWMVKGLVLVDQCIARIKQVVPQARVGRLQGTSRPDPMECDCVVASLDTVVAQSFEPSYFAHFGMVIVDEAHMILSTVAKCTLAKIGRIPLGLFLTATPRKQELRWFGGPILVTASRPHVAQTHIAVYRTGIDMRDRAPVAPFALANAHNGRAGQQQQGGDKQIDVGTTDICIAYNMARNAFVCDTIAHILWRRHTKYDDRHAVYRLNTSNLSKNADPDTTAADTDTDVVSCGTTNSNFWSHVSSQQWMHALGIMHRRTCLPPFVTTMFTKATPFNLLPPEKMPPVVDVALSSILMAHQTVFKSSQRVSSIVDTSYDEDVGPRVPIIFAKYVSHTIIMQHMLAQRWMDDYKAKHGDARLLLVRTGLRQLAVVDLALLEARAPHLVAKFKWLDFLDASVATPHGAPQLARHPRRPPPPPPTTPNTFSTQTAPSWNSSWGYSGPHSTQTSNAAIAFDQAFFEAWVTRYTPSAGFAAQIKARNVFFKVKKTSTLAFGTPPVPPAPTTPSATSAVVKKKVASWDASDWTQYAQYFWTPVYWPLPTTQRKNVVRKPRAKKASSSSTPTTTSKKRKAETQDEGEGAGDDDHNTSVPATKRSKTNEHVFNSVTNGDGEHDKMRHNQPNNGSGGDVDTPDKVGDNDTNTTDPQDDGYEFVGDVRPDIFAIEGAVLATFGLIVGKSSKFPSGLLFAPTTPAGAKTKSTPASGLRTFNAAHFHEALNSDYIFANYQAASTGLDHDLIDTTIDVHPGGSDDEQRKGRGMREAPNKQSALHIQFPETFSLYGAIARKHLISFEAQAVKTLVYAVDVGRGSDVPSPST